MVLRKRRRSSDDTKFIKGTESQSQSQSANQEINEPKEKQEALTGGVVIHMNRTFQGNLDDI